MADISKIKTPDGTTYDIKDAAALHLRTFNDKGSNNNGKYYKVTINSDTFWMLSIGVWLYHSYTSSELTVSGYKYGANHWYSPQAELVSSTSTSNVSVTFGYDSDSVLWFAIPAASYAGMAVFLKANGYYLIDNEKELFTIELVSELSGTIQTVVNAARPWRRDETVSNATHAASATTSGELTLSTQVTGSTVNDFKGSTFKVAPIKSMTISGLAGSDGMIIWIPYNSSYGRQIVLDDTTHKIFSRYYNNGTWGGWEALAMLNKADASTLMNTLDIGSSTPVDADYYISQYVGGGTSTTTYHRRPMSALWEYVKSKISSVLGLTATNYDGKAATAGTADSATNASKVNNHTVNSDVPANAKFTDTVPTATDSGTTEITASTTATKTTLGTAFTIPNVTSAGSASTWAFEEVSIPNVTAAGSASTWAFEDIACDDITSWSAGSGSASISGAVDSSDSTQLNITISHTHTAPSLSYTARTVSSKKSGANGSAPTLGTAIKVQSKKSGANGSAPTLGTAFTVPNVTGNTSATVSVTDPGHTHSI